MSDTQPIPSQFIERRAPQEVSWHLKKEISLGLIIAIIIQIVAFVSFLDKMNGRMDLLAERQALDSAALHAADTRMAADFQVTVSELKESIKELNRKMDRLIERGNK